MVDDHRLRKVDTGMQSTSKEVTVYLNHGHYHVSSYLFFLLFSSQSQELSPVSLTLKFDHQKHTRAFGIRTY